MAMRGNLKELYVADLIQLYCQPDVRARLSVQRNGEKITLYFDAGEVVHAQAGDVQGEEAVYALLAWETGTFEVEPDIPPPDHTIHTPWSALILEGMRRLDEGRQQHTQQMTEDHVQQKEIDIMAESATRSERLAETLKNIVETSADIQGVVVISRDGLVIGAQLADSMDQARTGAVAAGLLSLSGRSLEQLARGEIQQTLVQGTEGNVIVMSADRDIAFVALTDLDINMGMVLLEAREGSQRVARVLKGE